MHYLQKIQRNQKVLKKFDYCKQSKEFKNENQSKNAKVFQECKECKKSAKNVNFATNPKGQRMQK